MAKNGSIEKIDGALASRVATMSRGSQRWLKTALQAITTSAPVPSAEEEDAGAIPIAKTGAEPKSQPKPASLEDVITGKADLREHLDAYPELKEELDGMAEVIDLLREVGKRRRGKGEQILREEILGEKPEGNEEGRA